MHNAVFRLLDRISRAHSRARGIFAMHADDGRCLRAEGSVHKLEVDHGSSPVRLTLHTSLHAGLASDASRRVDEELKSVHKGSTSSTFSTRHAQTLYSGIFETGSNARFVMRLADFFPGQ